MARTKVHGEYLDPSVISAQTEVTAVGSDHMLIFDATDNALKKALLSDLIETVGSTPTFTSLTVDDITINGSTISDAGDLTLDVGGDIILDADGGDLIFKDGGTTKYIINTASDHLSIENQTSDADIKFIGNDGGGFITALTLDMSDGGRASFNNKASFSNPIAVGQSTFSGGSILADFHGSGSGVGAQLAFANDHNTDKFYVGLEGNTSGDGFLYQQKNADINFYTNNTLHAKLDNLGNFGIGTNSPVNYGSGSQGLTINGTGNYQNLNLQVNGTTQFTLYTNGVSGTFINQLTADPMMFYTSDTERMRITSTGGVEVGDGTNYGYLKVISDNAVTGYFDRRNSNGTILEFRKDDSSVGSIGTEGGDSLYVQGGTTSGSGLLYHGTGGKVLPARNSTSVDAIIDLGQSSRRFKDLYLSGGAYLGGTAAGNHLDDYEEGFWTPVLSGSGYSFGTHSGVYVKVGRMVYVTALLSITTVGNNTSSISISGYPFTSYTANNNHQIGIVRQSSTTGRIYVAQINVQATIGGINSMDGITSGDNEIFTTGSYSLSLTYMTN